MMLVLFHILGCTPSPPQDVHLSERLAAELCRAPHVVIGHVASVQSFEERHAHRRRPEVWSDTRFLVEERLRGEGAAELRLVMAGPERDLRDVQPAHGAALQPAVGLRYVLTYTELTTGGRLLDPGDPGVSAWRPVLGSEREREALIATIRRTLADCPTVTPASERPDSEQTHR